MKECDRDVKNSEGFLILRVKNEELAKATNQGYCVCDSCFSSPDEGYYVAVLNMWFCPKCYVKWKKTAIRYSEDIPVETKNYRRYKELLSSYGSY